MAPPRRTTLLLPMALLLLFVVVAHARAVRDQVAIPAAATSRDHAELRSQHRDEVESKEEATGFKTAAEDNPCGGGGGAGEEDEADQEECLMRRTLEAHTDYIYTQNGGHS